MGEMAFDDLPDPPGMEMPLRSAFAPVEEDALRDLLYRHGLIVARGQALSQAPCRWLPASMCQ